MTSLAATWRWAAPLGLAALACSCGSPPTSATGPPSISIAASASATPSQPYTSMVRTDGISMAPTLPNGALVAVDSTAYASAAPRRGDIVIFTSPGVTGGDLDKRVIGVPGDTIEIDTTPGASGARVAHVLIEPAGTTAFQHLEEPYLPAADHWSVQGYCCDPSGRATEHAQPLLIPSGEYFMLGDNRNFSEDSRALGLIPLAAIHGKVLSRISPPGLPNIYSKLPSLSGG